MPPQHRTAQGARAVVRNVIELGARLRLEQHQRQMIVGAHARRSITHRIRPFLGGGDQRLQGLVRAVAGHAERAGVADQVGQVREVIAGEARLTLDRQRHQPRHVRHCQCIAVRLGARHVGQGDRAGRARLVLDNDGRAQFLFQEDGQGTGRQVGAAAGRKPDHQFDGPVGPGPCRQSGAKAGNGQRGAREGLAHQQHFLVSSCYVIGPEGRH